MKNKKLFLAALSYLTLLATTASAQHIDALDALNASAPAGAELAAPTTPSYQPVGPKTPPIASAQEHFLVSFDEVEEEYKQASTYEFAAYAGKWKEVFSIFEGPGQDVYPDSHIHTDMDITAAQDPSGDENFVATTVYDHVNNQHSRDQLAKYWGDVTIHGNDFCRLNEGKTTLICMIYVHHDVVTAYKTEYVIYKKVQP
jgi:hypothetical protein